MADPDPGILAATSLLVSASAQLSDAELTEGARDVLDWLTVPLSASAELAASMRWALLVNLAAASLGKCLLLHVSRLWSCCNAWRLPPLFLRCCTVSEHDLPCRTKGAMGDQSEKKTGNTGSCLPANLSEDEYPPGHLPCIEKLLPAPTGSAARGKHAGSWSHALQQAIKIVLACGCQAYIACCYTELTKILGIQACKDTATHQLPSSHKASPTSWRMQQHHAAAGMSHGSPLAVLLG